MRERLRAEDERPGGLPERSPSASTAEAGTRANTRRLVLGTTGSTSQPDCGADRHLHEPVAHASFVLLQEHGAELGQRVCSRIVERPEDALPVLDRERQDDGAECECLLEHASRWLVDERGELPDIVLGNLRPASIIAATLYERMFVGE
jgi:hypothetical protein